jgi:hypothetical protein
MLRKAIVHIGPMKTGSSSIQHWLFQKADLLGGQGVHVVRALGPNMSRLAGLVFAQMLDQPPVASDQEKLEKARAELAALPETIHTIVISGEMLGHQLHRPREVRTFKALFDEFCSDYRIIAYLRRQDELSTSLFSTALRRGERNARKLTKPFDYEAMLGAWSQVFGREAITPRIFDRASLTGGDVIRDFADTAGFPYEPVQTPVGNLNPSLRPEAQHFLKLLKQRTVANGHEGPLAAFGRMDEINRVLNRDYTGKGTKPARAEAVAFVEAAQAGNEAVRQAWFPDRPSLFSEDFSGYPEAEPAAPSAEVLLDVAMAVLAQLVTQQSERAGGDRDAKERGQLSAKMREHRKQRAAAQAGRRARADG